MNFVSTSCNAHFAKMKFLENKHQMQAFLTLAESKVKSWIIKYGRQESVQLILQNYVVSTDFQILWVNCQNTVVGCINIVIEDAFVYVLLFIFVLASCLHQSFVEKQHFFEKYESLFQSLKQSAEAFVTADSLGEKLNNILHTFQRYVKSKNNYCKEKDAVLDTVTQ